MISPDKQEQRLSGVAIDPSTLHLEYTQKGQRPTVIVVSKLPKRDDRVQIATDTALMPGGYKLRISGSK